MRLLSALALSVALCAGADQEVRSAPAQNAARRPPELPGEAVEFPTRDGWTIAGRYSLADPGELTFVLLHDARGRHQDWRYLARALAREGIGYLAIDLRGHNLSQKPPQGQPGEWRQFVATRSYNEWDNMREDAAGAVEFLKSKGVPEIQIGLGGADVGGSIALKYAAVHTEVPMVFMLSPGMSYREVLTVNAMRAYKGRPILMVAADDDPQSSRETAILYQFARLADGAENVTLLRVAHKHGTRMLAANGGLAGKIVAWIENPTPLEPVDISTAASSSEEAPAPGVSDQTGIPSNDGEAGSAGGEGGAQN